MIRKSLDKLASNQVECASGCAYQTMWGRRDSESLLKLYFHVVVKTMWPMPAYKYKFQLIWQLDEIGADIIMARSRYGVLILEGNWGKDETTYLTDSRSTSRLYMALEDLLSLGSRPVKFIQRPLLASRFAQDIRNFVSLTKAQGGGTVIILSAHGSRRKTKTGKKRRVLQALDGKLNLSLQIKEVGDMLGKTILVLDSCEIGEKLELFQRIAKALAVIGFRQDVGWVESAVFILAFLDKLDDCKYFSNEAEIRHAATAAINAMWSIPYKSLAEHLGAEKVIGNEIDRSSN